MSTPSQPPWWHAKALPWTGRPSRSEWWCWGLIGVITLYGLVLAPFRAVIPTWHLLAWSGITGSAASMLTLGAATRPGTELHTGTTLAGVPVDQWWPLGVLLATLAMIKFNVVYWWAGRLWGQNLLDQFAGSGRLGHARADRAQRVASRWGGWALVAMHVLPIFPVVIVCAAVGMAGMRLSRFLAWNLAGSLVTRLAYVALGYAIGQPVIAVFNSLERYAYAVSAVLLVIVVWYLVRRIRANRRART
ncbi:VTT domain-containing protein [Micrococcales bacterium 31B]|nr:VTT domain-containing protein [Micrococcales bacterium 31B]